HIHSRLHAYSITLTLNAPQPSLPQTLSLHDALPIFVQQSAVLHADGRSDEVFRESRDVVAEFSPQEHALNSATTSRLSRKTSSRSEEHTSELQSLAYVVCRLLLE